MIKKVQSMAAALIAVSGIASAQVTIPEQNLSLKLEVQRSIDKGIEWLKANQKEDGSWGDSTYPALTALPLSAIMGDPGRKPDQVPDFASKGYEYLVSLQKRDGGFYIKGLGTYNTALSLMALVPMTHQYETEVREARRFLINQQADFDERGVADNELDGGIGYGGTYSHSDLSNTHLAMEALYYSKQALEDTSTGVGRELNWDAAVAFVSRCQNLETNDLEYVAVTDENRGGMVYFPGDSKAGEEEVSDEKVALRSYGSMSYAGLLSFMYAQMDQNDPRVQAVKEWLGSNYSLEENPGMGAQGLYYYYHTMAKALALLGNPEFALKDGTRIDWREQLALKLMSEQQPDGSWINEGSNRWMEDDPVLVTSYSLLALEHIWRQL